MRKRAQGRSSWSSPARWCWPSQGLGYSWWSRSDRSEFARAVAARAGRHRALSWTDWAGVRRELGSDVDARSTAESSARSSTTATTPTSPRGPRCCSRAGAATAFGFSPASVEWELFSQSADGAVVTLRPADDTDFGDVAGRLEDLSYPRPQPTGVGRAGRT